jgi:hypothetical protein
MIDRILERLRRGWRISMTALHVLRSEKQLIVFPLFSSVALLLVFFSFIIPLVASEFFRGLMHFQAGNDVNKVASNVLVYLVLFAFYFCNYFVIVFFNSALVACVLMHFNGEEPTVSDGFRAAFSRLPQILMWALVSATVGVILKIIAERSGKIGEIIANLLGAAWGIMTYFVVPVLVVERVGPFAAIKRSTKIMVKTWGEGIGANFGIGLVMLGLTLLAMIPFFVGMFLVTSLGVWALVIGFLTTLMLLLVLSLMSSALNAIVITALYQFAAQKRVPPGFKEGTLRKAFGKA